MSTCSKAAQGSNQICEVLESPAFEYGEYVKAGIETGTPHSELMRH